MPDRTYGPVEPGYTVESAVLGRIAEETSVRPANNAAQTVEGLPVASSAGRTTLQDTEMQEVARRAAAIASSIGSVILGKEEVIRACVVALLAGGHVIVEDFPGVGKTLLAKSLARSVDCRFARIQFTPGPPAQRCDRSQRLQPEDGRVRIPAPAPSLPTSSSPTRSTGPHQRPNRASWSAWKSARSRSTTSRIASRHRSW